MTERIAHIVSLLPACRVFADIGCDHGYMTCYMLRRGLCERAYISDISAKSLAKAQKLLAEEIAAGKCIPVVANGLEGLREPCDFVLIAGIGGEETVKILERGGIPARFLLQPMKNTEKVRRYLVERGAGIERDYTFSEGKVQRKYYDLILGSAKGGSVYSEKELRFGRDNLRGASAAFLFEMKEALEKTETRLKGDLGAASRAKLETREIELWEIIHEVEGNIRYD